MVTSTLRRRSARALNSDAIKYLLVVGYRQTLHLQGIKELFEIGMDKLVGVATEGVFPSTVRNGI